MVSEGIWSAWNWLALKYEDDLKGMLPEKGMYLLVPFGLRNKHGHLCFKVSGSQCIESRLSI